MISSNDDTKVFVIDGTEASEADAAAWVAKLRNAGLDATGLSWPRLSLAIRSDRVTARDVRHFARAAETVGRPVVVGTGSGAIVAYRLLGEGVIRAAVLIDSDFEPGEASGTRGPILLLDRSAKPNPHADVLRENGICDQQLTDPGGETLTGGECGRNLARYILDWLDFHGLAAG